MNDRTAQLTISPFGLSLIEAFEGFFARPYKCPAGVLTQGFGHTAMSGGEPIGGVWTIEKARQVLRDDLARMYEPAVRAALRRVPTQYQYDALVSLCFNIGPAGLARSSVVRHFNRGDDEQAAAAFALWVKAGGRTLPGLVRRRASEALLFQGISDTNWNGRRDPAEPLFGDMAQAVEPAREKLGRSRTIAGGATAGIGGVVVAATEVRAALEQAEGPISAGTWIGIALGVAILLAAGLAVYAKWDDAGRPLPWRRRR